MATLDFDSSLVESNVDLKCFAAAYGSPLIAVRLREGSQFFMNAMRKLPFPSKKAIARPCFFTPSSYFPGPTEKRQKAHYLKMSI